MLDYFQVNLTPRSLKLCSAIFNFKKSKPLSLHTLHSENFALPSESPVSGTLMRRLFPGKPHPTVIEIVLRSL